MEKQKQTPSLWQDARALAGLYRDVFRMYTQRVRYGADWQDTLVEPEPDRRDGPPERELAHSSRR